jgi:hypothetical protein
MDINNTKNRGRESLDGLEGDELINVRAIITCPNGDYKKKFKNKFLRKEIEMMIVSFKVFDWLTCSKCGELLKLDLEFNI